MILQYKGFKNNWCYEEADQIIFANVYVGDVIEEVLKKEYGDGLEQARAMQNAVDEFLKKETGCYSDEIIYHTEGIFKDIKNVCVVMLNDKNKHTTRVFYKNTAYLLNNRGQTIQRLS